MLGQGKEPGFHTSISRKQAEEAKNLQTPAIYYEKENWNKNIELRVAENHFQGAGHGLK